VNRRAVGCAVIGVALFLAVGAFGLSRTLTPSGCPQRMQYIAQTYLPDGSPVSTPEAELVQIGSTFIGLTTRAVYAEEGAAPSEAGAPPERFVLDCADGTFQAFIRADAS
jgi:hypothetical protein